MQAARTRTRWRTRNLTPQQMADYLELAHKLGVHPLLARLLYQRDILQAEQAQRFLTPRMTDLYDPALLPGAAQAAQRLAQAVRNEQPIVIYGDYDVDGISASAILWQVLTLAGGKVRTYVPHRIDEGYGLNCEAVRKLCATAGNHERPLLISVDCGITAVEPARVARELGVDLIITDHHEFDPHNLPAAHTIVHPRLAQKGQMRDAPSALCNPYPFPDLCGAGVAFKLAWQFAKVHCGSDRVPSDFRALLLDLLSFAALGTVADVVPLVGENRVITIFGLGQIKRTAFAGLNALIDVARLRDEKIDSYHVGFVLGPRLNACGRMGHAQDAVRLLTTAQGEEALEIARMLTHANDQRRATEREIWGEARQMVLDLGYASTDRRAIVVGKEGWHAGVVGIVASRLVEEFCRPVVLLSLHDGEAHGSARSIEGVSIHEAFTHCAGHLTSFGGHAMAGGLRLPTERLEAFRQALVAFINSRTAPEDLVNLIDIDAECALEELSLEVVQFMRQLQPFGRGNPEPVLCVRGAKLEQAPGRMGGTGKHLSLLLRHRQRVLRAVGFGMGDRAGELARGMELDVAFEPTISTFRGPPVVELRLVDVRAAEGVK